jgi:hypothetical protein
MWYYVKREATLRCCLMTLNWYQNICDDGVKWARPMWPQRAKQLLHLCHCLMLFFEWHPTCHLIKAQANLAF